MGQLEQLLITAATPPAPSTPTWIQAGVIVAGTLAAFSAVFTALWTSRRSRLNTELQNERSRVNAEREELMRTLRWAAEQTAKEDESSRLVGVEVLDALSKRDDLHHDDQDLVAAVLVSLNLGEAEVYAEDQEFVVEEGGQ
ncbi:hypothetical protein ACWKWA_14800 [Dermacoccus abyssi]